VISKRIIEKSLRAACEAVVIRTLPNTDEKKKANYSGHNPPYLTPAAMRFLRQRGVKHVLVDLPSVDREEDEGKLVSHREFWSNEKGELQLDSKRTITELCYVPNDVEDGLYVLNLQV
jgi:arylformamidase